MCLKMCVFTLHLKLSVMSFYLVVFSSCILLYWLALLCFVFTNLFFALFLSAQGLFKREEEEFDYSLM